MKKFIKGNKQLHETQKRSFWASVIYGVENFTDSTQSAKKNTKEFIDNVFKNQEKNAIFPFHQYWKANTS